MPRLTADGPDLPIELLEAHAAGELVLFVGAGASIPAGFPDFKGLARSVYQTISEEFQGEESRLFKQSEYDRVLSLLEVRVGDAMRRAVLQVLAAPPSSGSPVHEALLDIAAAGNEDRIVTTNFDRLFLESENQPPTVQVAPRLGVPRVGHWKGLVHLHGLIEKSDPLGSNLILTSADFGRAYLLDRWASRFVSELFQNFDVLFIGYGVNDPVMRYLLAALAAEHSKNRKFRNAFALAGIQGSTRVRQRRREEWCAKGVRPIFYDSRWRHRRLVQTLTAWAELSRGGLRTRQSWVLRHADDPPSSPEDDDARFVVWALSEPSGAVARSFADRRPVPDIGWLRIFEDSTELPEGAKLLALPGEDIERSQDGTPHPASVPIADRGWRTAQPRHLSAVTKELSRWLTLHLDKVTLLDWALRRGGVLHPEFRRQVQVQLRHDIRLAAPLRRVWEVLASDAYAERLAANHLGGHLEPQLHLIGTEPVVKQGLLRLLAPVPEFRLRGADDWPGHSGRDPTPAEPQHVEDLVDIHIRLCGGSSGELLLQQLATTASEQAVGKLAIDASSLLKEALEWLAFCGTINISYSGARLLLLPH